MERSALTLLPLTHSPTGAPVAAPTTSLPEHIGGVRNWDYRYTWLRYAALGLTALQRLGSHDEAMVFWEWLAARANGAAPGGCASRTASTGEATSTSVSWATSPVIAVPDRYGWATPLPCNARTTWPARCSTPPGSAGATCPVAHPFAALAQLADRTSATWREPDRGVWEVRSEPRHFLHSKLMLWVALDRAVRLAEAGAGDAARWRSERDAIAAAILAHGVDPISGAFTRAFDSREVDAAALAVPIASFLPASDARVKATIRAVREGLESNGLLYRYLGDDGLPGRGGAFLPCTFWLAESLALAGDHDEAHAVFERAARCANDVGLLAEEADPVTGELLGNHPQAFSHLALIAAALALRGKLA